MFGSVLFSENVAMIDKLDVRVGRSAQYSKEFERLIFQVDRSSTNPFHPSPHYTRSADLRGHGHPAIVHLFCLHGEGHHKIELIDTAKLGLRQMEHEIERLFAVPARTLEVMRIDLAADIQDVTVSWFADHARVRYKRANSDVGTYSRYGKLNVETFYLGKRPNLFRIYDKHAELQAQYRHLKKTAPVSIPSFQEFSGYPEERSILTRVERQIGGGRVPEMINTVADLKRLPEFDPYDRLEFLNGNHMLPNFDDYPLATLLMGLGARLLFDLCGNDRGRKILNSKSKGNAAKILKKLKPFLPGSEIEITPGQIFEAYRATVLKQIAA